MGFKGDHFVAKVSPTFRWATARQYFEIGPQLEAGYALEIFSPVELRWMVVGTPFVHRGSSGYAVDYELEAFLELVYRFDRR